MANIINTLLITLMVLFINVTAGNKVTAGSNTTGRVTVVQPLVVEPELEVVSIELVVEVEPVVEMELQVDIPMSEAVPETKPIPVKPVEDGLKEYVDNLYKLYMPRIFKYETITQQDVDMLTSEIDKLTDNLLCKQSYAHLSKYIVTCSNKIKHFLADYYNNQERLKSVLDDVVLISYKDKVKFYVLACICRQKSLNETYKGLCTYIDKKDGITTFISNETVEKIMFNLNKELSM